jgi:hypothetical protein
VITFEQLDRDFDEASEQWTVTPAGQDVRVVFTTEFDLGMPSIAAMINPSPSAPCGKTSKPSCGTARENTVLFATEAEPSASPRSA